MKKILHIISQYPGKTGSGVYLRALMNEASKKGYSQGLIAGISKDDDLVLDNIDEKYFYPVVFNTETLPFPIVGMSDVMPYESTRYKDMTDEMFQKWEKAFSTSIRKALNDFKPDIIISHHLWILTSLVRKLTQDIPLVSICHGTDIRQFEMCSKYREYVLEGCSGIDNVFALNEFQKEKIVDIYGIDREKISVIGGGFDSDIFYPSRKKFVEDRIRLIYAGKISYSKGVLSLIGAYDSLDILEDMELYIVGSGSGKEAKVIKSAGEKSKNKIVFTGEVSQATLGDLFRESQIFVLPSFYEGLSLVTIEALACGLRVVATDIPGLRNFLGYNINSSGIVKYVKLPSMIDADTPDISEINIFEERLRNAMKMQIDEFKKCGYVEDEEVFQDIKNMSWENIFKRII